MDRHRQPPPTGHLQVGEPSSFRNRSLSPSPSQSPINPATPAAVDETAIDYFPALSEAPSIRSRISPSSSRPSSRGAPANRPGSGQGRLSSIRLRRPSSTSLRSDTNSQLPPSDSYFSSHDASQGGRPRSISQPERAHVPDAGLARHSRRVPQIAMPRLTEEGGRPSLAELGLASTSPISPTMSLPEHTISPTQGPVQDPIPERTRLQRARRLSRMFWPGHHQQSEGQAAPPSQADDDDDEYNQELVDWLDIIDPEVQTLSTLTNVQNSLFIPDLGKFINRRPTYVLSQHGAQEEWARGAVAEERRRAEPEHLELEDAVRPGIQRTSTISSRLTESHYAALPHGTNLEGWSAAEKTELDDHVRHMLHSRRSRFKRSLKGFGQYVRRPLGFFVTLYATLITLFGLAWVLFLIGWIYVGEKQVYAIHVIDSVLVALFAVMGDGLIPFRIVDTYHMFYIARYSRKIRNAAKGKKPRSRLQKRNIPESVRESLDPQYGQVTSGQALELLRASGPCASASDETRVGTDQMADLESAKSAETDHNLPALTYAQLKSLQHHQNKFAKSHSFYKPQETFTHHSFPLKYLIAIVILLDCHSCLQISLGACTWGIDYHTRPFALTTVILCVSITCNVAAGLLISRGDRKTRKKDVMELINRQELTEDAIRLIEEKRKKEQEKEKEKEKKEPEGDDQHSESSRFGKLIKSPT